MCQQAKYKSPPLSPTSVVCAAVGASVSIPACIPGLGERCCSLPLWGQRCGWYARAGDKQQPWYVASPSLCSLLQPSDLAPTLVSRARRVKHSAAGQGSRLCSPRCWLPSPSLPNQADIPFPIVSVKPPWEPCEPGRENRSSSENSSLLSHSQCRCSQERLGTDVGITWCCRQMVYDINLLL